MSFFHQIDEDFVEGRHFGFEGLDANAIDQEAEKFLGIGVLGEGDFESSAPGFDVGDNRLGI